MRRTFLFIFILSVVSCSTPSPLEQALRSAGENRSELEKVLDHYSRNEQDSLKYKAACFLIENMPYHHTYTGPAVDDYYREITPLIKQGNVNIFDSIKARINSATQVLKKQRLDIKMDIMHIDSEFLISHIDRIFLTREYPWNKDVSFEDFCEYVLPYRINNEPLEDWLPAYTSISKHIADSLYERSDSYKDFIINIVNHYTEKTPYIRSCSFYVKNYPTSLLNIRYGTCQEIAMMGIYIFKSLGIPVCMDFTPNWVNRAQGHNWNGIEIDDVYYPFIFQEYSSVFGNHLKDKFYEKFSKIYRSTYSIQKESLFMQASGEELPNLFSNPFIKDVSDIYKEECSDINMELDFSDKKDKIAYIMVFNNKEWIPVDWAKIKNNRVDFHNLHKHSCYLITSYDGKRFKPLTPPFIMDDGGNIETIDLEEDNLQDMVLFRKYPIGSMGKYLNRSVGGEFHGSNDANFSRYKVLYTVTHTITDMRWHTIDIDPQEFKYLRYYSAKGGYNNIAEIKFVSANDSILTGKIIGEGEYLSDKPRLYKHAFDGNPLTFFESKDPDDSWVGLELKEKMPVKKIIYIFRNNDNNIRLGDMYELLYWDNKKWKSLGTQKGVCDSLIYTGCPTNAVFVLKNHTRGNEERIFTYGDDTQIWW